MRYFDFEKNYNKLLTPEIVSYLTQIHEFKGLHSDVESQKEILAELVEIAKIQSTEASNRIEGIITTDDRLKMIVKEKTMPKTKAVRHPVKYNMIRFTTPQNT